MGLYLFYKKKKKLKIKKKIKHAIALWQPQNPTSLDPCRGGLFLKAQTALLVTGWDRHQKQSSFTSNKMCFEFSDFTFP